jgi:hypothetical protein
MNPFDSIGDFAPTVPGGGSSLRRLAVRSFGAPSYTARLWLSGDGNNVQLAAF